MIIDLTEHHETPPLTPGETQLPGEKAPGEQPALVKRTTKDVATVDMFVQGGK